MFGKVHHTFLNSSYATDLGVLYVDTQHFSCVPMNSFMVIVVLLLNIIGMKMWAFCWCVFFYQVLITTEATEVVIFKEMYLGLQWLAASVSALLYHKKND